MQKSFKTTAILAAVLVVLLGWYFVYEQRVRPDLEEQEEKGKQLVQLSTSEILELEFERAKNVLEDQKGASAQTEAPEYEKIRLHKTGDAWNLAEPVQGPADDATVSSLLGAVTSAVRDRVVEEKPGDLAAYGLKHPRLIVRVRKDSQSPFQEIRIGQETPVGFNTYAQAGEGEPVVLTARSLPNAFNKKLLDLRDKQIVDVPRFAINEVEVTRGGKSFLLKKDDKDNWLLAHSNLPADSAEWSKTLTALVELKAEEFIDSPKGLAQYGLDSPALRISLNNEETKKTTVVLLGKQGSNRYAKVADKPLVYRVDPEAFTKIDKPEESFRSLNIARFNRFNVREIRLEESGKDPLVLTKEEANWKLAGDKAAEIDGAKVEKLLTELQDAKIERYLNDKPELKSPTLTVRLFEAAEGDQKPKELLVLRFNRSGTGYTGTNSLLPLGFHVSRATYERIPRTKEAFLKEPEKKAEKNETKNEQAESE